MYHQTQEWRWADAVCQDLLGALSAIPSGAVFSTPKLILYKEGPTPGGASDPADFTPCDFHGYAPAAITLSGPVRLLNGDWAMLASATFIATTGGPLTPQNVAGCILTNGTSEYYGGEEFQETFSISEVGHFMEIDLILPFVCFPKPQV